MRRAIIAFLFIVSTFAFAQGTWTPLQGGGCIGGRNAGCNSKNIRIPLEDRPILAVRLSAHDNIGPKAGGAVRVKIDGNIVENFDAVKREVKVYQYDVDELRGRFLIVESAEDDEIEVSQIAVLYAPREGRDGRGRDVIRRVPRDRGDGWRRYAQADACIGGNECRKNGNRITIALEDRPVLGVRFWASDEIGPKAGGVLNVRIDDTTVESYIDIKREGRRHELDVDNVEGSRLVIETGSNDEVDVKEIEVLYARGRRGGGGNYGGRELTHEGGCIGGTECGGSKSRIRIALNGRAVESIRLYAHDEVGPKAGGELRIRIDDQIVEYALDVKREGRTVTIDSKGVFGDYLYIEPATSDEVVVKDVRVKLGDYDD
ncbi:MAG TPA: hypothetical protein VE974_09090 [Thermoanaerobaculia bacterium]|nr:hypothetical protein [Thermoanaerobaculia bacterium]